MGLMFSSAILGQSPIKSVDEQGNVTYSDRPLPGAVKSETVPVDPAPSEEEVQAARERLEKTEKMAEEARRAREEKQKKLEEERKAREAAKPEVVIIQEGSGGGYYPEYVNPPLIPPDRPRPPLQKPDRPGQPDHPAYRPPGMRPPVVLPQPR